MIRKILLSWISVIPMLLLCCTITDVYAQESQAIEYTIRKGDTFYLLAERFHSSISSISSMNPKMLPENLPVGKKLKLSPGTSIALHHVKPGDTLWKIANIYNSSIGDIRSRNYIQNPNLIYTGDILAIPYDKVEERVRKAEASYTAVKEGDFYIYNFTVKNTSDFPNDSIYGMLIGLWYDVPITEPPVFQRVLPVKAPRSWDISAMGQEMDEENNISLGTNWMGSIEESNYIQVGDSATFTFRAKNPPPMQIKFGVCYYNGNGVWGGKGYNGYAVLK